MRAIARGNLFYAEIRSGGDGARGIHALFGRHPHRGLHQADARLFLKEKLEGTAGGIRRKAGNCRYLHRVMDRARRSVIKPQAEREAGARARLPDLGDEERKIWKRTKQDPSLFSACLATGKEEHTK